MTESIGLGVTFSVFIDKVQMHWPTYVEKVSNQRKRERGENKSIFNRFGKSKIISIIENKTQKMVSNGFFKL